MARLYKSKESSSKQDSEKKEELKTYQSLGLDRISKSKVRREKLAARGAFRIIGGTEPDRPPLRCPSQRLREIHAEVAEEILSPFKHQQVPNADAVIRSLRPKIERTVYDRMAAELHLKARFQASNPQGETPQNAHLADIARNIPNSNTDRAQAYEAYRANLLDDLVSRVRQKQRGNPQNLQQVWREIVGHNVAQTTWLDRVDNGVAYFRCANPALGYELQRNPKIAKQLSATLKTAIRQIRMG